MQHCIRGTIHLNSARHGRLTARSLRLGTRRGPFYHYTNYNDASRLTVEAADGLEVVKIWDEHREAAEIFADCDLEGKDHMELAGPGLEKSVPIFVDKPFAYTVADVKKMLQLSRRHGTPVMSLSILRSLPHATWVREGIADDLLLPANDLSVAILPLIHLRCAIGAYRADSLEDQLWRRRNSSVTSLNSCGFSILCRCPPPSKTTNSAPGIRSATSWAYSGGAARSKLPTVTSVGL
jgi:hypothetical protein